MKLSLQMSCYLKALCKSDSKNVFTQNLNTIQFLLMLWHFALATRTLCANLDYLYCCGYSHSNKKAYVENFDKLFVITLTTRKLTRENSQNFCRCHDEKAFMRNLIMLFLAIALSIRKLSCNIEVFKNVVKL